MNQPTRAQIDQQMALLHDIWERELLFFLSLHPEYRPRFGFVLTQALFVDAANQSLLQAYVNGESLSQSQAETRRSLILYFSGIAFDKPDWAMKKLEECARRKLAKRESNEAKAVVGDSRCNPNQISEETMAKLRRIQAESRRRVKNQ